MPDEREIDKQPTFHTAGSRAGEWERENIEAIKEMIEKIRGLSDVTEKELKDKIGDLSNEWKKAWHDMGIAPTFVSETTKDAIDKMGISFRLFFDRITGHPERLSEEFEKLGRRVEGSGLDISLMANRTGLSFTNFINKVSMDLDLLAQAYEKMKKEQSDTFQKAAEEIEAYASSYDKKLLPTALKTLKELKQEWEGMGKIGAEQREVLDDLIHRMEMETRARGERPGRGFEIAGETTRAVGAIPGMEPFAGVAGGLVQTGQALTQLASATGWAALILGVMKTVEAIDKFQQQLEKTREAMAVAGAETWQVNLFQLQQGIEAAMRGITAGQAGADVAFSYLGQLKTTGLVELMETSKGTLGDLMRESESAAKQGGEIAHTTAMNLAEGIAEAMGTIRNFASAFGVSADTVIKGMTAIAHSGMDVVTNQQDLLRGTLGLITVGQQLHIGAEKYIGMVEEGTRSLRYYGFTMNDVVGLTEKFGEELESGRMTMRDFVSTVEEMFGTKARSLRALATEDFLRQSENMGGAIGDVAKTMKGMDWATRDYTETVILGGFESFQKLRDEYSKQERSLGELNSLLALSPEQFRTMQTALRSDLEQVLEDISRTTGISVPALMQAGGFAGFGMQPQATALQTGQQLSAISAVTSGALDVQQKGLETANKTYDQFSKFYEDFKPVNTWMGEIRGAIAACFTGNAIRVAHWGETAPLPVPEASTKKGGLESY
jgi:hypothetical protein